MIIFFYLLDFSKIGDAAPARAGHRRHFHARVTAAGELRDQPLIQRKGGVCNAYSIGVGVRDARARGFRSQLIEMFCDVVGSTELSARVDPEEMRVSW